MRLSHPDLDPATVVESDDADYIGVLRLRGWEEAPALPALPDVSAASIKDVLAEVGDDPDLAAAALEEERAGKARKSLIAQLEQIAAAGGVTPTPDDTTSAETTPATEESQA
jgi:hypothetical protein